MSAASPSAGITWTVTPLLDLYGNVSTSFETPTTTELANRESGAGGFNPTLLPQKARSAEVGVKGRMRMPGVLGSWQVAVYDARVRDALIAFEVPAVPGRQYFRNAGSTKHRGVESGATLVFPQGVSLRAAFTHVDATYDHFAVTSGAATTVYDGRRVPGVAANRFDGRLSVERRWLFVDVDAAASSSIPVDDANANRSPAYVVWGARAGLPDVPVGAVTLTPSVGVMNAFGVKYNSSVVVNAFGGRYYEPGPPRSLYGGLTVRF